MYEAGGRLFVDVTPELASPAGRAGLLAILGSSDPLIGDALRDRRRARRLRPVGPGRGPRRAAARAGRAADRDRSRARRRAVEADRGHHRRPPPRHPDEVRAGTARLHPDDFPGLTRIMFDPRSIQVLMAGMEAVWWLNEHLQEWLGERNAADALTQSVPHNITSEMGLALLDVADAIRPYPEVVAFLHRWRTTAGPTGPVKSAVDPADRPTSWPGWTRSPVAGKPGLPSSPGSTGTACGGSARSTSPGPGGANAPPCWSR